jgi:hypothetical protein
MFECWCRGVIDGSRVRLWERLRTCWGRGSECEACIRVGWVEIVKRFEWVGSVAWLCLESIEARFLTSTLAGGGRFLAPPPGTARGCLDFDATF